MQTDQARSDDQLVADLLYGRSSTITGSGLDDQSLIQVAQEEFSGRPFSVVRDWMILDMMMPAEALSELTAVGKLPLVLLANRIVHDSDPTLPLEGLLVTGYSQDFFGCFFEVDDKVYVLAGRGARKYAAMPELAALRRVQAGKTKVQS